MCISKQQVSSLQRWVSGRCWVAFVIFEDVYTPNKAFQNARTNEKRVVENFVSIMEFQLEKTQWKVERDPSAADIY